MLTCDRVRSSVRPLSTALSEAAGRYGDLRIGSKSAKRTLRPQLISGFPGPDLFDRAPIQVIDFSRLLASPGYLRWFLVTPPQPEPGLAVRGGRQPPHLPTPIGLGYGVIPRAGR